ncbi:MAG: ABC transporter permease [Microcella sp.]|uniref:ABC transporter permease n=1 Tax=Microcella sp. TaxID=1913979 RepID=UPI0024C59EF6|nr:ABC transporter permease [Microcella sp.]UYN84401.1 MAG: ABC transporter permease [Microcella sp.]
MTRISTSAVRAGALRGAIEFRNSLQKPADLTYYLIGAGGFAFALWFFRNDTVDGVGISVSAIIFPSAIALMTLFVATYGLATLVSTEREDGTVLRLSILPAGTLTYAWGQTVRTLLELAFTVGLFTIIASIIVPDLWIRGGVGVALALGFLLLGILACLPLGFVVGSLFSNPRSVGGWGFIVIGAIVWASGILAPLTEMPHWAQVVAQSLPLYWLGLGLRSALLPEGFAVIEVGESWRTLESLGVLGAWAVLGLVLAPLLLQRVARRDTFATLASRREKALQRV